MNKDFLTHSFLQTFITNFLLYFMPYFFLNLQNKTKLVTYVVASGLTYGAEENIFHYLFKVRNS